MEKLNVSESVALSIKNDIFSGKYKVGDKYLSESELCIVNGVSRTTVREALRELATLGIVELKPGRGAFVASVDETGSDKRALLGIISNKQDYLQLTELRLGIEPMAARLAAERASEDEIFKLYGVCSFFEKACKENDAAGMTSTDEKFHSYIAEASKNELYIKLYNGILSSLRECKSKLFTVEYNGLAAINEHKAIVDAIAEGDADKAEQAMRTHIMEVYKNIKELSKRSV